MSIIQKDIVIIGAGLSGIGAACHLKRKNKNKNFILLEAREALGGTWDYFKYPGIRSDSDMYTFGYSFKSWDATKSFADAPSILKYVNEAAEEYKVKEHIVYNTKAISYNFNSETKLWEITAFNKKENIELKYHAQYIFNCSGYYNYDNGYTPEFKGLSEFKGTFFHPQKWPKDLDYKDKKVVVIGSGATAVTIVPEIANEVEHVTMLQRSPTYIGGLPNEDKIASFLKKIFSKKLSHRFIRLKNITLDMIFFNACRRWPNTMRNFIVKKAKKELGDYPVSPHFVPDYNPWEQRFCLAPDGDLFKVLKDGKASMVTDHIETFTENGIQLKSGNHIEADIIVSATGLKILPFGGAKVYIDNKPFDLSKSFIYKGLMLSNLPNFFIFVGYTNASWTLKSDLTSEYVSRVLHYLDKNNYKQIQSVVLEENLKKVPMMNLDSGYLHRAASELPSQSDQFPWRVYQNYFLDYKMLRMDAIKEKHLEFIS